MKKSSLIIAIVAASILALGSLASAYQGSGCPRKQKSANCPMTGATANLSEEDAQKLKAAGERYMTETADLRQAIYEKSAALNAELAKKSPDAAAAMAIQKEISEIQGKLDQKKLEHIIEMKGVVPGCERYFMKYHGGKGYHHGGKGYHGGGGHGSGSGCGRVAG